MTPFEEDFCGSEFWDQNRTWYTYNPDFTPCFHKTILAWFPTFILCFFSINELRLFYNSVNRNIPWSFLNVTKMGLTLMLIILSICEIAFTAKADGEEEDKNVHIYPVDYVTPIVYLVTYLWYSIPSRL